MRVLSLKSAVGVVSLLVCASALGSVDDVRKFDEWGDIPFSDEKARLDNVAILWHDQPLTIVYLVVSAGRTACVGEAKARGTRAKNYLVRKRQVEPKNIVVIDGGYKESVLTEIWFLARRVATLSSSELNLKPNEVTLERNCRIKCRACR